MTNVQTQKNCRICKSAKLSEFLDLGKQPLANAFLNEKALTKKEPLYRLRVLFCRECNLVQLGEVVNPSLLFRDYIYYSRSQPSLPEHFKRYAEEAHTRYIKNPRELIVEIGSNDGLFLSALKEKGARVLGVDPARNIAKEANKRGIETVPEFFGIKTARHIRAMYGPAKLIIGNNVVAHIADYHTLGAGVSHLLAPDGVFIFEAPYLVDMFENLAFDTIYHEHASYLAIRPLTHFFKRYGMEIFRVELHPVQGNSIRVFVARKGSRIIEKSVNTFLKKETRLGLHTVRAYRTLAARIKGLRLDVRATLAQLKKRGAQIAAYGAPAKGNTLLNYFGITNKELDYATEEMPSKIGLFTPGTHIPVIHRDLALKNPPDYFLMLAWNYKHVIVPRESEFKKKGGRFIMPIGKKRIV